jgi:nucleoside-diphosphate-sugar epimerase
LLTSRLIIGCGYLGRRVARSWVARGDTVYALTRSPAHAAELKTLGCQPRFGDVTDPQSLSDLPECDTLLYAVGQDRTSGKTQREVYVEGLKNVLDRVAAKAGQFLYISSTSVYGQNSGEWVDESSPCQPGSPGGRDCLARHLSGFWGATSKHTFYPLLPSAALESNYDRESEFHTIRTECRPDCAA